MKKLLLVLLMAILTNSCAAHAAKPLSPIQVSISPSQAGVSPGDVKPGDVVELRVIGRSYAGSGESTIKIELQGGVELVSGETVWTGVIDQGAEKVLTITVRSPIQGGGTVRASVSMSPSAGAMFVAEAEYRFGKFAEKKPAVLPEVKKDNKGRAIREYRVD